MNKNEDIGFEGIVLALIIGFILIWFEACWSKSVAEDDIHGHKYIVVGGEYYATEDIDYIDTDVVWHDKHVITIHFKNGVTYQTQEGQYVFSETKPIAEETTNHDPDN